MIWILTLLLWLTPALSHAAYTLIQWDWDQGSGPAIDGFKVKCGQASGAYTITTTVANPAARSVSIYTATNGRGPWFCTVVAYVGAEESSNASEASFVLPVPPAVLFPGF